MGIFKSIFSSNKEKKELETIVRTTYKNNKFYNRELTFNSKAIRIISEDNDDIMEREGRLYPRNYGTIFSLLNKRSNLLYSKGEEPFKIVEVFERSFDNFILSLDENFEMYSYLINMCSKAILFDLSKEKFRVLGDFITTMGTNQNLQIWKPDKIIGFLMYEKLGDFQIPDQVLFPLLYQQLEKVVDSKDKNQAAQEMKIYLDQWYDLHKQDPWYDNHKKQRGYSGYWSWESAAVVKVMGLDDSSFKDHPHYPYDMVHFTDTVTT